MAPRRDKKPPVKETGIHTISGNNRVAKSESKPKQTVNTTTAAQRSTILSRSGATKTVARGAQEDMTDEDYVEGMAGKTSDDTDRISTKSKKGGKPQKMAERMSPQEEMRKRFKQYSSPAEYVADREKNARRINFSKDGRKDNDNSISGES